MADFFSGLMTNSFVIMFTITVLGYLLGSIKIKGLSLGTSGVLIVALVYGHFGLEVPGIVRNLGLILFVTAVGYIAGPVFFRLFRQKAVAYIILGLLIVTVGAVVTVVIITWGRVPAALAAGMFTGALTSTPGLAAATEVLGDMAATGYGIAYPFGVIGVVLFVQLVPKFLKADMPSEVAKLSAKPEEGEAEAEKKSFKSIEGSGFFAMAVAVVLGMVVANIKIPLGGGMTFSLGTSGGPLIVGLILGHFRHIGPVSVECPESMLETVRELGLIMFLMGAGTQAGAGFVEVLKEYGFKLFIFGALITLIPMVAGYIAGKKVFKLEMLNNLGSITGGMTSTPALGALVTVAGSSAVAASYAATYPVALIMVVLCTQAIGLLFG